MVLTPDFDSRPIISFQHVWKTYPTGTEALRDINLVVHEGDFLFLVGPSGAGKSTLVRLLIREEKPTKGKIFVDGVEIGRMKRRKLPHYRRRIGLVFQDFTLLPNLTVYENVAFAMRVPGEPDRLVQSRAADALDTVGLAGKEQTYPSNLSGGEQQRVAIARALVHAPRMIIADEPTGNLDPATAWEIMQLFLRINARGATVVMATHNREIVDLLRRRVVAIDTVARRWPGVDPTDPTNYQGDFVNRMLELSQWLSLAGVGLLLILLTVSVVIVMNTIRTAVYHRRKEIEVMKLVGATEWFVRGPFVIEGIMTGLIAASIALALLVVAYPPAVAQFRSDIGFIPLSYDPRFLSSLARDLLLGGALMGAVGSYIGVWRFVRI